MKKVSGVSFYNSKKIYYFAVNDLDPKRGSFVIVETERGLQYGKVVTDIILVDDKKLSFSLSNIVRVASLEDKKTNDKNISDAKKALNDAKNFASRLNLDMNILDASFTFDRKQLLLNFMASERIDFRELARKLAGIYKTRIELRQIGVRDKAKVVGGFGQCGQELCCARFLKDISSVSINMAKNQNLALNPQKINGICGRLMCCLSYENDCYSEYKDGLPKVGKKILYNGEECKVISTDIFARTYKLENSSGKIIEVSEEE